MAAGNKDGEIKKALFSVVNQLILVMGLLMVVLTGLLFGFYLSNFSDEPEKQPAEISVLLPEQKEQIPSYWTAPDIGTIPDSENKKQIQYGRDLIAHTSKYLGPKGSVMQISNGLNCQNCHLQAGTVVFGNNYGSVASTYPKLRSRSGKVENIYKRVNDCFERSLNGSAIDTGGREMKAIFAYINFLGTNVKKGEKAPGSGFKDLAYLERAADPEKGMAVYSAKCVTCHQADGTGVFNEDKTEYVYPALWGESSYNDGAGLYRISNFAKYVKYNMPLGATYENPQLTDEEAWDVAAYVNSRTRPHINASADYPDKSKKPVDHPYGPYADNFPEKQHKYGPFKPIAEKQNNK